MPGGVNYRDPANRALGAVARPQRFYDGTPGYELVACPDCGSKADAMFGDHGGACLEATRVAMPNTALGVVHRFALEHQHFSANDVRPLFDQAAIARTSRGPAFTAAVAKGWIEAVGTVPSLDSRTKRHRIQTYDSLIHPERKRRDAVRNAAP